MSVLAIDVETVSEAPLDNVGAAEYALHPSTRVICMAWAFDDEPVFVWSEGEPLPHAIEQHIRNGGEIRAWNAEFEATIWELNLVPRLGWPQVHPTQWVCTMVEAMSMALPASLENCGAALGLDVQKDKVGHALMLQMTKPRKARKGCPTHTWWHEDDPAKFARLKEYCGRDVETERAVRARLWRLPDLERRLWLISAAMNRRGVRLDRRFAADMQRLIDASRPLYNEQIASITGGAVTSVTQNARLIKWVAQNGVPDCTSLAEEAVEALLDRGDLSEDLRRLLTLKREAGQSSVAKVSTALSVSRADGRVRGSIQFHSASTGRSAGRLLQLQNLPRGTVKHTVVERFRQELARSDVTPQEIADTFGMSPLALVSSSLRGLLVAAPGKRLIAADLSNIEGRGNAGLAREAWKLQAFRDYDEILGHDGAGKAIRKGPDIYSLMAASIYRIPVESVTKERQVGKTAELALQFGAGVNGLAKMAAKYRIKEPQLAALYDGLAAAAGPETVERATEEYHRFGGASSGLSSRAWIATNMIKLAWRGKHPATRQYWKDLSEAALLAVGDPGTRHFAGRSGVSFEMDGNFLVCNLPSGKRLAYADPKIKEEMTPWGKKQWSVTYCGWHMPPGIWRRAPLSPTIVANNTVQGSARDIFKHAQIDLVDMGYHPVLEVHDEHVFEEEYGFGSLDEVIACMTKKRLWAAHWPLAAAGFEAERYRKDD